MGVAFYLWMPFFPFDLSLIPRNLCTFIRFRIQECTNLFLRSAIYAFTPWDASLGPYLFFVCKYAQWPHCCSHMRRDHTEVTDYESKLKPPIGIKGHIFIRIIHPNTISCTPICGEEEWRLSVSLTWSWPNLHQQCVIILNRASSNLWQKHNSSSTASLLPHLPRAAQRKERRH